MIRQTRSYRNIRFAVFDIETLGLIPKNFLYGTVYYGPDSYKTFTQPYDMFQEIISRKNKGMKFIAHNAEYDLLGLCDDNIFKKFGYDNVIYRGSHFILAKWPVYKQQIGKHLYRFEYITFWDSYRFLMASLDKIGKVLDFKKLPMPE